MREYWLTLNRYIKGPIKNQKSIKNGVIRFNETKITVKNWLRALEEER
jgi:hypothetical protein